MKERTGTPFCPACVEDLHDLLDSKVPWVTCGMHEDQIAAALSLHSEAISDALRAQFAKVMQPPAVLEGQFTIDPLEEAQKS